MPNIAILYTRTSTDRQDTSIEVQNRKNDSYLPLKDLFSIPELTMDDPDVSGRRPFWERPNGKRATAILRFGLHASMLSDESRHTLASFGYDLTADPVLRVKTIVFSKVDRMGRNAKSLLELFEWIQNNGLELHIVDFFGDSLCNKSNKDQIILKVMFGLLALFAELEVENTRQRIRETFEHKRGNGELCGLPAYGQDAIPSGRLSKRGKEIMLVGVNVTETAWLRQMLAWRADGLSLGAIARNLNDLGVPTKNPAGALVGSRSGGKAAASGRWSNGSVGHALTSQYALALQSETKSSES